MPGQKQYASMQVYSCSPTGTSSQAQNKQKRGHTEDHCTAASKGALANCQGVGQGRGVQADLLADSPVLRGEMIPRVAEGTAP